MKIPTKAEIECLRDFFPAGTRIELIEMDDPLSRIRDKGSYQYF